MADFDINAYLAKEDKKTGFDINAYLKKTAPETALQTFGRSTASMADSALNAVTGTLDSAAYPLARAFGKTPEQAQAETTSPKDVFGRAFGVAGTAGYENAPLRQLGNYIGEGLNENVVQPLAEFTGISEQDIGNMVNSGMMAAGAVAPKVIPPVYNAGKTAVGGVGNVAKGALGSGFGYIARPGVEPKGYQIPSARAKLGNDFVEPKSYDAYNRGQIPIEEMGNYPNTKPMAELPQNVLERTALRLGGGTMPFKGQAAQAFGERLGETYRNPVTAAIDLGSAAFTGIPFYTAGKTALGGIRAAGDYLMSKKGFDPMLPETLKFAREAQQTIEGLGGVSGPVGPGGMAAATPAATAAMATTQRVSGTRAPRAQAQPEPFTMPTAQETFDAATAARPSHQSYEAAADAVAQRTKDILKQARIEGRNLSPEAAANIADDEIRAIRFPKKSEAAGPKLAQENENPALVKTPGEGTIDKPNVDWDRNTWFKLQDQIKQGKPLLPPEQSAANSIIKRYGPDPFGSGDLTGQKMFNTVAQGETTPIPTAAEKPTPTAEMPVIETPPKRAYVKQDDRLKAQEAERTAGMTPEQIAADEKAIMDRVKMMADPNSPFNRTLRGTRREGIDSVKTTPKVEPTPVVETPAPKATPKPKKLNLADDKTNLTTKEIKSIFNSEGVSDIDSNMMNQVILEKHRMNFPSDWKQQIEGKSVKEIKEAANLYKEQKQGLDAFKSMFESKGYTTPTYWHISDVLGNDLPIGDRALINVNKMSKEELSKRVDSYIEKNPDKVFNIEDLLKEPTAKELADLAAIEKEIYGESVEPTKKSKSKTKPKDAMEMTTGPTIHADVAEAARDFLQNQMTKSNGMLETSYRNGKDIIEEQKYPGYHRVEIKQPNGTSIVMKEHTIGDHTEYSKATMRGTNPIPVSSEFNLPSKPKEWISVIDEITKGK